MSVRWITLAQLVAETGLSTRALQYIRQQEPGVLVARERGGKTEYRQPDCATNLRRREREAGKRAATPPVQAVDFERARARKMTADAQLAEIEVAKAEGRLVPIEEVVRSGDEVADRLRAVLINLPANYGLRLEEAGVPAAQAESVLEAIAEELTRAIRQVADDLIEEADRGDSGDAAADAELASAG